MTIRITPIRTGSVRIKTAQKQRKPGGTLRVLFDQKWTAWLPILALLIEHPEGPIVVDTGETARTVESGYFPKWHPYYRWAVQMDVKPDEEIGPQLDKLGVQPDEVRTVVLTHLHTDHAGGLHHFPKSKIFVDGNEYHAAKGFAGKLQGYLPHRWPAWFDPIAISLAPRAFGPFARSFHLTKAGDVTVVPTPGHTPDHISVIVRIDGVAFFLAGDTSYTENLMVAQETDGVSPSPGLAQITLEKILAFARQRPLVYLPSHDPESANRLLSKQIVLESSELRGAASKIEV